MNFSVQTNMGRIMNFCADQLRTRICGRAERILKHCFVQCQPKCCVGILTLHNMNWIVFVVKKGHSCWSRADVHIIYDVILYLLFFLIFCWCSTIFFPFADLIICSILTSMMNVESSLGADYSTICIYLYSHIVDCQW
jgi:hypothetical protein